MRYTYKVNYSEKVKSILRDPQKSRKLIQVIHAIRRNPESAGQSFNGFVVRTHSEEPQFDRKQEPAS
jgi:hypothetical protein